MSTNGEEKNIEEIRDIESLEEPGALPVQDTTLLESAEYEQWSRRSLNDRIPSLFLDSRLKILRANESFYEMFGCESEIPGTYFTRFYSPFFDEVRSSLLFRSIISPATGYSWSGRVERRGLDELQNVSKIWVMPVFADTSDGAPRAYTALCLDMTVEYRELMHNTFSSLLEAARLKDNDTGNHIERVNMYAQALAADISGLPDAKTVDREFIESISLVAALHDVGKIGTPDDILNKVGTLEAWEWDVMKQHTTNGAYILSTYPNPMAHEIALRHHERWDGSGYPHGLSQGLIPLSARVVAIADVYDALRMRRAYKEAYSHERAVETMCAESGTHFDPFLIERFNEISSSFKDIFSSLADSQ